MIEINLLPDDLKGKARPRRQVPAFDFSAKKAPQAVIAVLGLLVFVHIMIFASSVLKAAEVVRLKKRWVALEPQRKELEKLLSGYATISAEGKALETLAGSRLCWAEKLNKLSLLLPPGIWFREVSANSKDFILQGSVVSLTENATDLIKKFVANLKADSAFLKGFVSLELSSTQQKSISGFDVDEFTLTGTMKGAK